MSNRRTSDRQVENSLPLSKQVSDAVGRFGLALMTLGAAVGSWRMFTGHEHASIGKKMGMALMTLGMLWLNWYLWRHPNQAITPRNARATTTSATHKTLQILELRYRRHRSAMEWFLTGYVIFGMFGAVLIAIAMPIFWIFSVLGCAVGCVMIYILSFRDKARKYRGVVLRIDDRGIKDQRFSQQGLVPWRDIHHLEMSVVQSSRHLVVWFKPNSPSSAKSGWRLYLTQLVHCLNADAGDWFIDLDTLDCRAADVEHRAIQGLAHWRYQHQASNAREGSATAPVSGS